MRSVSPEILAALQKNPRNIRHICILAHVDHGKTTLADSILASNGIISQKMAGKLRYMDSRKDEQERGITMKSSSVAVYYLKDNTHFLVNLIDSPGHVDFAGEVCTAVRLCDGAIILVDVVEGICPQTKVALQQAWIEHIKPLLVLNKIDRLITEWKLSPLDAYAHLVQILEQVNAVMGELFASDVLKKSENKSTTSGQVEDKQVFDWSSGLDDYDDSSVYFSPELGNVIFASALDGWGFGISQFAKIYAAKVGMREDVLRKTLWGDFYLSSKTKQILRGAQAKAKKPLFVQLILENIWSVYDAVLVQRDKALVEKIVNSLNLAISTRDANHRDPKVHLQAIFGQWLPLSKAVLEMVCTFVPSPLELSEEKIEGLMCSSALKFEVLPEQTRALKQNFQECSASEESSVIVCISKMFPMEKKMLPENKQKPLTYEEIALRREKARQKHAEKSLESSKIDSAEKENAASDPLQPADCEGTSTEDTSDTVFIAFARVYSGCVKKGQQLYVLGPKHDPAKVLSSEITVSDKITVHDLNPDQHITIATIKDLYLLMGKELIKLDTAPAGNVIGIGGLQNHVLKSATLSSTVACPSFIDLHSTTVPIVRVALEPVHAREMPALVKGMRLLNQADPCVQVFVQETGEHVLVSSGEVHLQRCIDDLKERFAKIDINVSSPIVPFRETVIPPPKVDMVNEVIEKPQQKKIMKDEEDKEDETCDKNGCILLRTPNKMSYVRMKAKPLPVEVTKLLEENGNLLKIQDQSFYSMDNSESESALTSETLKSIEEFKKSLNDLFSKAGPEWKNAVDKIWCFGPRRCGPNILLNQIPNYKRPSFWTKKGTELSSDSLHFNYDSTFISGFQLATLCGPLCDEPMMGVCFVVEDWGFEKDVLSNIDDSVIEDNKNLNQCNLGDIRGNESQDLISDSASVASSGPSSTNSTPFGPFTGQIMSTVKEACKKAFQAQPQRLMAAMYSCNIQVTTDMLGKMYAVLGRRNGRILHADIQEGSQTFHVSVELPVIESFDFANEIRKQTSGLVALPQLVFSHWEVVDVDPFWEPCTEEEYAHFGEKADVENRARKYMNNVRRRKGLPVDEKIVEHAEKQRTLTKNK
uniref:Ribosome assembly protein 1 n=1 Tax=Cupiennius salei TaxID=6928 RepID=T1DCE6_CUPSA